MIRYSSRVGNESLQISDATVGLSNYYLLLINKGRLWGGFEHSSCIPSEYPMSAVRLTTSSRKKCQSTSDNGQRTTPFLFTPYSPSVRSLSRLEVVPHARMNSKMSSRWSISCRRHSLSNPSQRSEDGLGLAAGCLRHSQLSLSWRHCSRTGFNRAAP